MYYNFVVVGICALHAIPLHLDHSMPEPHWRLTRRSFCANCQAPIEMQWEEISHLLVCEWKGKHMTLWPKFSSGCLLADIPNWLRGNTSLATFYFDSHSIGIRYQNVNASFMLTSLNVFTGVFTRCWWRCCNSSSFLQPYVHTRFWIIDKTRWDFWSGESPPISPPWVFTAPVKNK